MKKLRKGIIGICIFILLTGLSACTDKNTSDVKTVVVPEDAVTNIISGKYKNSLDENLWQFNANGTLLITDESGGIGEYDVKYKDSSMYLTNEDGAAIEFYFLKKEDGNIEITINGQNADTSTLVPIEKNSIEKNSMENVNETI